jgi:H+/Cl- antiporter ClcA
VGDEVDPHALMRSRQFLVLLVLSAIVGLIASLAAWLFLELVNLIQTGAYEDLPTDVLGFDKTPVWWPPPLLVIAGVVVAFAVAKLPGNGGHIPADGLNPSPTLPAYLPGVILAALGGIGLGTVLGPEAPLMALGGGLGYLAVKSLRSDAPPEIAQLVGTAGMFAGLSFLFGSPLIAAVIVVEAAGLGGKRLPLVLIPGLLAAGIGSLVETGMGSWTGVNTSAISLELLPLSDFARPDFVDFLWTIPVAAAIAIGTYLIFLVGRRTVHVAAPRPFLVIPAVGAVIAGLAILFHEVTDKGLDTVLFSGQEALGPLIQNADSWSLGALAFLLVCKGLAYALALGSFRGGPVFPAMFLGAAAGLMAAQLPGFEVAPAVAVGIGAAVVAVLRLPLSAVVLATLLTSQAGLGVGPLIILGVVVAYLVVEALPALEDEEAAEGAAGTAAPAPATSG